MICQQQTLAVLMGAAPAVTEPSLVTRHQPNRPFPWPGPAALGPVTGTSLIQVTQGRGQPQALGDSEQGWWFPAWTLKNRRGFVRVMRCCSRSGRR